MDAIPEVAGLGGLPVVSKQVADPLRPAAPHHGQRIDIVDLVSQRVRLKRSGKNQLGLCPFHDDKSPSFYVSSDTGRYKCFSCGETGDIFTWVMKTQGLEFFDALKLLADQAGVTLSTRSPSERVDRSERDKQLSAMEMALIFFTPLTKRAMGTLSCSSTSSNESSA